jgi:hypothetical protein
MHPETFSGTFTRLAAHAGLPPIRLHDLRHSTASILLARGVHPKVVSEPLGHATIALTLDTYSHVIPSLHEEAAGVMAAAVLDSAGTSPEPASSGGEVSACGPLSWTFLVGRDGIEPPTLRFSAARSTD